MNRMVMKEHQVANPQRTQIELTDALKAIDEKLKADSDNADLWMERGLACAKPLGLMREAVEAYSRAIALDPFRGIFYRHRAHRHLSCWEFEEALADFVVASRLIPENWDVWYHLGLSYFLLGDYEKARKAYKVCHEMSDTEDKLIAITDWYWITLMRLGREQEAAELLESITGDMDFKDNIAYYNRLKMYKGELDPEALLELSGEENTAINIITQGFGVSNYYYLNGEMDKSNAMIERIIEAGDESGYWTAFGYLAAMADKANRAVKQ